MAVTILGQLERSIPKEEIAQKMIFTLGRLIKLVEKPQDLLPRVARLFSAVDGRVCRQALVGVLGGLQENKNLENTLKVRVPDGFQWHYLVSGESRTGC